MNIITTDYLMGGPDKQTAKVKDILERLYKKKEMLDIVQIHLTSYGTKIRSLEGLAIYGTAVAVTAAAVAIFITALLAPEGIFMTPCSGLYAPTAFFLVGGVAILIFGLYKRHKLRNKELNKEDVDNLHQEAKNNLKNGIENRKEIYKKWKEVTLNRIKDEKDKSLKPMQEALEQFGE